jgi:site-specific recombinase XerD
MYSIRFVFDRKGITKSDKNKKALVQIEVFDKVTRKKVYLSTGIKLFRSQYSDKGGLSIKNHPNAIALKGAANSMFNRVEAFIAGERCKSIDDVKKWDVDESMTTSVVDFIKADLRKRNVSYDVHEYNNSFLKRLIEFGKIKTFNDINYNNIEELDLFLRKTIKSAPTLYKRHALFKGYLEKAKRRGLIKENPYSEFVNKKGNSKDPVFLFEEEIKLIIDYNPSGVLKERISKVKDLFLFQCFTGLSYADMSNFSRLLIVDNDGMKEIHGFRQKTKQRYVALFLPIAEGIAEKYDYKLPVITNQKYNEYLKQLAQGAGISKPITSHAGRHTFATYMINKGISIESVSKILGHSNIRMTQHYARVLGKTAIQEMKEKLL